MAAKKKKKPANNARLSAEALELVKEIAVENDMTVNAATEKLIKVGFSRMQALSRYAAKGRKA
jgi:hypothetical protein